MGMDSRPWYNSLNGFIVHVGWTYCNLCWWGEISTLFTYLWCPEISVGYKGKGVCSEFDHVLCYNVIATLQPGSGIQGVSTVWIFYVYTLCLSYCVIATILSCAHVLVSRQTPQCATCNCVNLSYQPAAPVTTQGCFSLAFQHCVPYRLHNSSTHI